jgi:hypothetical protein
MDKHYCSTCEWFVSNGYREYVHAGADGYQPGRCHKHAPTERGFPPTQSTAFCGEHSARARNGVGGEG